MFFALIFGAPTHSLPLPERIGRPSEVSSAQETSKRPSTSGVPALERLGLGFLRPASAAEDEEIGVLDAVISVTLNCR